MLAQAVFMKENKSMIERVGIIGGGQLGQMLTEAALPLGFQVTALETSANCPAGQFGAKILEGEISDRAAITQLAEQTDVLTWEIEHIPSAHLLNLAEAGIDVQPHPQTLEVIQDKLHQKRMLQHLGVPVAPFSATLDESAFTGGGPYVIKARRGGFDGRGNLVVDKLDDPRIKEFLPEGGVYAEQKLNFEKEISVVAARSRNGDIASYPLVETVHKDNICNLVIAPAEVSEQVSEQAAEIARTILEHTHGAGIFAIEMFAVDGTVLVNEIAPRVHNSGHHTIEANVTSQFEQHIRAITGMPLGSTESRTPAAAMINILGKEDGPLVRDGLEKILALPDTHPHLYGKSPRLQRKIGHITVLGSSTEKVKEIAEQARKELTI